MRIPARRIMLLAGAVVTLLLLGVLVVAAQQVLAPKAPRFALPPPHFVAESDAAGIHHDYEGGFEYFTGGGVAAFDCNGDFKPELYLAGGSEPAALYVNVSSTRGPLRFEGHPSRVTDVAAVVGAYPLDVDGDGLLDLAVLRNGEAFLLRGLGDCRFERGNERWGFDGGDVRTSAFSATWESSNALPTLALGAYFDESRQDPTDLCNDNLLFRPDRSRAMYGRPFPLTPSRCALSMLFSDWGRSGHQDLRVSNDVEYYIDGEEQLWRIVPGQPPRLYTHDEGWEVVRINGMGIASQDLTGDGYPEIFLTNQASNRLQMLAGDPNVPRYTEISIRRGATAGYPYTGDDTNRPSTAWHDEFADVNSDGFTDLFIAKGNVEGQADYAMEDPSNLLIGQADGTFEEGAMDAGIVTFARGRGAAVIDLNLDGLLDLVEVFRRENVGIWRNVGAGTAEASAPMGHWLQVRPHQPGPNPDAIGAWLEVRAGGWEIDIELTVGGGHVSGQAGWIHVGLGSADRADVRVRWPDGSVGPWRSLAADGFYLLERDGDETRRWSPS